MEAVFRKENFWIFSGAFRQELVGNFPAGILLPCSDDFRCIRAGSWVFSIFFLQVPSESSIWVHEQIESCPGQ